jgi:predicted DNA-binding transcriptional regulator YafY
MHISFLVHIPFERIKEIITTKDHFDPVEDFNPAAYFKHSFGISVINGFQPEKVVLAFEKSEAPFIKNMPLHQTQEIISDTEQELIISMEVIPSYELKAEIMRYGSKVKVLSPESWPNEHRQTLIEALGKYQ